jgi:hypothetical protein
MANGRDISKKTAPAVTACDIDCMAMDTEDINS